MAAKSEISSFLGLANVNDPVRVGLRGLVTADNVEVDATGALRKRAGRVPVAPGLFISGYATRDGRACYLQQTDGIYQLGADEALTKVVDLPDTRKLLWAELNGEVYFANASVAGRLTRNGVHPLRWATPTQPMLRVLPGALPAGQYQAAVTFVMPDGRETGAGPRAAIEVAAESSIELTPPTAPEGWTARVYVSAANSTALLMLGETAGGAVLFDGSPDRLGGELLTSNTMPLPAEVEALTTWRGSAWAATMTPDGRDSVVWSSLPLSPHLWGSTEGFFAVPGLVTLLADGGDALLVGTGDAIYAMRYGEAGPELQTLSDYGVPPGLTAARDGGQTYLWTKRGVCRYPEFTNLTERRVSVPPGSVANTTVVHDRGQVHFLACLAAGGAAFNQHE